MEDNGNIYKRTMGTRNYSEMARDLTVEMQKSNPDRFVSHATVRNWALGNTKPSLDDLAIWCRVTGTDPADYFPEVATS